MAKRRKSSSGDGGCLAIIVLLLIVFITPIILLGIFIYSLFKYFLATRYYRPFNKTYDDFWLNKDDKETYKYYDDIWSENYHKLKNIDKKVEEQGIARNNDGSISTRSNVGKKLKADFDSATKKEERAWDYIYEFMYLPQARWEVCNEHLKNSLASFIGLIGYGLGYIYLQLTYQVQVNWTQIGSNMDSVNIILKSLTKIKWFEFSVIDKLDLFILSICIAIITWGLTVICSKPLNMVTPYPPKVESDNVDLYEGKC